MYEKYDSLGTHVLSKLSIDNEDEIYYCCRTKVYHRKLYGPIISSHVAIGSTYYKAHANNGLFWQIKCRSVEPAWCDRTTNVVTLLSIASNDISKWTEYVNEEERKRQADEPDDCVIA